MDNGLSNIPSSNSEIEISNVLTSSKSLDAGVYGLFTLAKDFVDIENNEVKQKGKDAMFETYFNGNKDYLPMLYINEFELKNDFVKIIYPLANYNKPNKFDRNISLKIGSDIMYINGIEYSMGTPAKISKDRIFIPLRYLCHA